MIAGLLTLIATGTSVVVGGIGSAVVSLVNFLFGGIHLGK